MDLDNAAVLLLSNEAETGLRAQLAAAEQSGLLDNFISQQLTLHPSAALQVYVRKSLWDQYVSQSWPPLAVPK